MSRAINIDVPPARVLSVCTRDGISVSAIEALPNEATRVVLVTSQGALAIRSEFAKSILPDRSVRFPQWSHLRSAG